MSEARYSIGIDLGTTHCALSYVDLAASDGDAAAQQVLPIAQLSSPGAVASPELLPSFLYLPHEGELAAGDLSLPWTASRDYAVGEMARSRGAGTPIRLVSSAKSWLCHPGVDRRAAILPNDAPPEVARVSPLESSVRYLTHLREAWDHAHPDAPFAAAGRDGHDPRLVRPGRARADGRSRAGRRLHPHDAAGRAAGRALQLDPEERRRLAQGRQGRRHHPGGGRRRRHHRPLADRGGRARRQSRTASRGGGRAHPARRRQHGPGPGARGGAQAGRAGHAGRSVAVARADLRLPRRQGDAAVRSPASRPCRWWCPAAARS